MGVSGTRRRAGWALAAAVGFLLVGHASSLALSWAPTVRITWSRNAVIGVHGLAVTSASATVHLAFAEARGGIRRAWYRRSIDFGATWGPSFRLSASGAQSVSSPMIIATGTKLDAVWAEEDVSGNWVVMYRRSSNAGVDWRPAVPLSSPLGNAGPPRIARDAFNRVFVVWTDETSGRVRLRRSTDGGASWLAPLSPGTTTNTACTGTLMEAWPSIAAGGSVLHLVYYGTGTRLLLKRSVDGGATWPVSTTLDTYGNGCFATDIVARSSGVVVGYNQYKGGQGHATIRRSSDGGAHWYAAQAIGPTTGVWSYLPIIDGNGSTFRVVYEQDADVSGTKSSVFYRSTADGGATWTAAVKVSNSARPFCIPGGVGYANGKAIVAWWDWAPTVLDSDVWVRTGS